MNQVKGFTLLELIVTLTIISILISLGIPAMANWMEKTRSSTLRYGLLHSIQYSRKQAIHHQATITLCPGTQNCESSWGENLLIFIDQNSNAELDGDETLLKTISLNQSASQLSWNRARAYLRFSSQGVSALTGTLKYCSENQNTAHNFGLVISRIGRVRLTDDVNCS